MADEMMSAGPEGVSGIQGDPGGVLSVAPRGGMATLPPQRRSDCPTCGGTGELTVSDTGEYEDGQPLYPIQLDCSCIPDAEYEKLMLQQSELNDAMNLRNENDRKVLEQMVITTAPMKLVMYTEGLPFDGNTIYEKSLGGSETAAYYICRELAKRNEVVLYCNTERPGIYEGVEYRKAEKFLPWLKEYKGEEPIADIFICSRHIQHLMDKDVQEKFRAIVVWNHDIITPEYGQLYQLTMWAMDCLFFNSQFHKEQADRALVFIPERSHYISRNGVDLELVRSATQNVARQANKVIYTSRPDRGLDVLLEMWPRIKQALPDLHLYIAYYEFKAADEGPLKNLVTKLDAMIAKLPDVHKLPAMKKEDLYKEIASSMLLVYPSIFWETSCMAAIEAIACGTPVVTSSYCALKETVPDHQVGLLVKGSPRVQQDDGTFVYNEPATQYQKRFVKRVVQLMSSMAEWEKLHQGCLRWSQQYDYGVIGAEWDAKLREVLVTSNHKQTITACMIVKDGEGTLHRCLKSLKGQVDQIQVLIDDSSTDSSEEIAKKYTDRVFPFTWPDSFGDARNISIQNITTDWILWIDADETLNGNLRRYLRTNCFNSYAIAQVHLAPDIPEHRDLPCRAFRNGLGAQFYGLVHEQPELIPNRGIPKTFALPDVKVVHDGYGMFGVIDERWKRNHAYMARDIQENPWRDISWFSYMRDCVVAARRDSEQKGGRVTGEHRQLLEQAVAIFQERFKDPEFHWHPLAFPYYQQALQMLGYPEFAFSLAASPNGIPENYPITLQRRFCIDSDELRDAISHGIKRVLDSMNPKHPYPFEEDTVEDN